MRPEDLHKLPDGLVETIFQECPFLNRPEDQDDCLPVINEYIYTNSMQSTLSKRNITDIGLMFATRSNVSRQHNTIIHNEHDMFFATSNSTQGFLTKHPKFPQWSSMIRMVI